MAEVTRDTHVWIEQDLDRAFREWSRLPEVEATIDTWPEYEALDFLNTWALEEENLNRLRVWNERGDLAPDQAARYIELVALAERNRPIVDRLINGSPADTTSESQGLRNGAA